MAMARNFRRNQKDSGGLDHKLVDLRRVARVVAGGRRFSFRATVVVGDKNGTVGIGVAKGTDTPLSIEKAVRMANKSLIKVHLGKNRTIPYEVEAKYGSSRLLLKPARAGRGLVAGGAVRAVLNFAGIENVSAKILSRTTNKLNNARVTIEALRKLGAKSL